jgi:hypothetical protein
MAIEVGLELKTPTSYLQLMRFIKEKLHYSWRRLRKWLKPKQDPVEYERFFALLQKLKNLEKLGYLDLFYDNLSSFSMNPNVPYGWQEKGNASKLCPVK